MQRWLWNITRRTIGVATFSIAHILAVVAQSWKTLGVANLRPWYHRGIRSGRNSRELLGWGDMKIIKTNKNETKYNKQPKQPRTMDSHVEVETSLLMIAKKMCVSNRYRLQYQDVARLQVGNMTPKKEHPMTSRQESPIFPAPSLIDLVHVLKKVIWFSTFLFLIFLKWIFKNSLLSKTNPKDSAAPILQMCFPHLLPANRVGIPLSTSVLGRFQTPKSCDFCRDTCDSRCVHSVWGWTSKKGSKN